MDKTKGGSGAKQTNKKERNKEINKEKGNEGRKQGKLELRRGQKRKKTKDNNSEHVDQWKRTIESGKIDPIQRIMIEIGAQGIKCHH